MRRNDEHGSSHGRRTVGTTLAILASLSLLGTAEAQTKTLSVSFPGPMTLPRGQLVTSAVSSGAWSNDVISQVHGLRFRLERIRGCETTTVTWFFGIPIVNTYPEDTRIEAWLTHVDSGTTVKVLDHVQSYASYWGGCVDLPGSSACSGWGPSFFHFVDGGPAFPPLVCTGNAGLDPLSLLEGLTIGSGFTVACRWDCVAGAPVSLSCSLEATMVGPTSQFGTSTAASLVIEVPSTPPPETIDLVGMEAVQVVQDLYNSVPLVEAKETYVRVYLEPGAGTAAPTVAYGRLRGFRNGVEYPESPLEPEGVVGVPVSADALGRRYDWHDSLNFQLPLGWITATLPGQALELLFEPDPSLSNQVLNASRAPGGSPMIRVSVAKSPTVDLVFHGIRYRDALGTLVPEPTANELDELRDRLLAILPVSDAGLAVVHQPRLNVAAVPYAKNLPAVIGMLRLASLRDSFARPHLGLAFGSLSSSMGTSSACKLLPYSYAYAQPAPASSLVLGYESLAHEVGHLLGGLDHPATTAGCGCGPHIPQSTLVCPKTSLTYTADSCGRPLLGPAVGAVGSASQDPSAYVFGLDTQFDPPLVIDPGEHFALMSYCPGTTAATRRWIAVVEYLELLKHP